LLVPWFRCAFRLTNCMQRMHAIAIL
jgi:L-alanine-DL-glutamate epimerase-like enolase superfamily enzyme